MGVAAGYFGCQKYFLPKDCTIVMGFSRGLSGTTFEISDENIIYNLPTSAINLFGTFCGRIFDMFMTDV